VTHDLGPVESRREHPAALSIDGVRYFLVKDDEHYRLLSSICPHQGGVVEFMSGVLECPQHGWRFDARDGRCTSGSAASLASFPVLAVDGRLVVDLPNRAPGLRGSRPIRSEPVDWPSDLRIRLVGHASLEIVHGGFTLLTDPWLSGPAFLGAWATYPRPAVDVARIVPDAIWISHEHSDHFHPASLAAFDRTTPVYVPDFPNGRLPRELHALGFHHVVGMRFGRPYDLRPGMRITCFEPPGLWNDAIVLIELGDLRLLNINDAGVNHRVAPMVRPVDVLLSSFAPASSYPYAWSHLDPSRKSELGERARIGMLRMLHQAVRIYQPRYLLPFASHFCLWHPTHREFAKTLRKNTVDDVVRAFRSTPVPIIDMLPGGSWEPASGALDRGPSRQGIYDWPVVERWLRESFDQATFDRHHPAAGPLHRDELDEYFSRLNEVPDIAFCEDVSVTVRAREGARVAGETWFQVRDGRLDLVTHRHDRPNLVMDVPANVLRHLVQTHSSWDEAHIGFWCRFTRTPDAYSAGFWRLLQAPYYLRPGSNGAGISPMVEAHANVAALIERFGAPAERILGRYGLHCAGCPHATAESVAHAAERHGVEAGRVDRMLRELAIVLKGGADLSPSH
jgi:CMP-N-acetylneuraminate monooxygenase